MTDQASLTKDVVIAQGEGQVSTVVDGKAVLMNVDNGKYYCMDDIATRIWALIETPTAVGAVCDQLIQVFDVDRATCEANVLVLLNRLLENSLIRVVSYV
jgi:Coenzyme PQQ synthesis protein D (PqqD)